MLLTEYDEKKHMANTREEGRQDGIIEGRLLGQREGLEQGRKEEHLNTLREKSRADTAEAEIVKLRAEIEKMKKS